MKTLIKSARIIDPANKRDEASDILVENNKVAKIAKRIECESCEVIEASGKIVLPGLIDMHVHLREPGREDKETVESATRAALHGGVTCVLAMPNTTPAMDSAQNLKLLREIVSNSAKIDVLMAGTITKSRMGQELSDMFNLKEAGAVAISDDGSSVENQELMLRALSLSRDCGILLISHCEDKSLSAKGVVNLGFTSTRLGLRGIPRESEYLRVKRDIGLAKKARARIHIAHVSCKESVEIIAEAKNNGINVTAETAPHYFALNEEDLLGYDANAKINPPLRSQEDTLAIKRALKDGVLDAIASDHAPHTDNEKEIEFDHAEFGAIGLETLLSVSVTELIVPGILSWLELARLVSLNPAKILGVNKGNLNIGSPADLTIISPEEEWVPSKEDFFSKSKNSPFLGRRLIGRVEATMHKGSILYFNKR